MTPDDEVVDRAIAPRGVRREVVRLAVPTFFALVSEPLFLLADSAIVGHLGTDQLAGLGVAGAVLTTVVSLCVFLAYGTTGSVARQVGAGRTTAALDEGVSGLWLAVAIGVPVTAVLIPASPAVVGCFGAGPEVSAYAAQYLYLALPGITFMLLDLAATGVLRGLQDARTPLVVAVAANLANIALNVVLVYGIGGWGGLGIRGSALGTLVTQVLAGVVLVTVVVRAARRGGASLRPDTSGVVAAAAAAVPLLVRTLTLRACLLMMTYGAATLSSTDLATMQVALAIWGFLAFVLDAIAIAAQAVTGRYLGAGDAATTRAVTSTLIRWGAVSGVVTGVGLAVVAPLLGPLFTTDRAVRGALLPVLLVAAASQPLAGVVFVLDGILIGAGDGRYLAVAGLVVLVLFAPAAALAAYGLGSLIWLWVAFGVVFMGGRAVALLTRARGDAWLITGSRV